MNQWAKGAQLLYLAAIACAKASMLLLYLRLFWVKKLFRYTNYIIMTFVATYCTAVALATIFQCKPIRAGWNFFLPGDCASLQDIAVATGAFNIVSDLAIVVVPVPLVLKLQLRRSKMLGILAIIATGLLCGLTIPDRNIVWLIQRSVVVMAILREVGVVRARTLYDSTWTNATKTLWL